MAITTTITDSFVEEILTGTHNLTGDTIKCALYTSSATLGVSTTAYSATNEVSGSGYTAGGATMSGGSVSLSSGVIIVDFSDVAWTSATITSRGCLIYNASASNKSIACFDFGGDITSTADTFTVKLPTADSTHATLRFAPA